MISLAPIHLRSFEFWVLSFKFLQCGKAGNPNLTESNQVGM